MPHRRVRAQQVMIDDDDVRFRGALAHPRDVAVANLRTGAAEAVLGRRRDVAPERQIVRQLVDLRAIAGVGVLRPLLDQREVNRDSPRLAHAAPLPSLELFEAMQAQIVAAPLHVGRGERHAERARERRHVLRVDLFLQVLRARGDEHALPVEDGRNRGRRASCRCRCRLRRAACRRSISTSATAAAIARWPGRGSKAGSARVSGPSDAKASTTAAPSRAGASPPTRTLRGR